MTDKVQKIREEVERLKVWNNNVRNSTRHMTLQEEDFNRGKHSSYLEILNFIDSLQEEPVSNDVLDTVDKKAMKIWNEINTGHEYSIIDSYNQFYGICMEIAEMVQEEPVSEDLEKEIARWMKKHFDKDMSRYSGCYLTNDSLIELARYFAKWQEKKDQSTIELAEDHAMLVGMEKMKEQMMAKAVDAEVHIDAGGYPYIPQIELYDYDKDIPLAKEGDKYKVVLIKEE